MKKYLIALMIVLWASSAFALGTCTTPGVVDTINPDAYEVPVRTIVYTCTGDAANGTFPSTVFSVDDMKKLKGYALIAGSWKNGSTGATANSTLTLSTTNKGDILGGAGKGPTANTAALQSKFKPITDTTYLVSGWVVITEDLTLQVTQAGSATNSAIAIIVFDFVDLASR